MNNQKKTLFTSVNLYLSIILVINLVLAGLLVLPVKSSPNTIRVPQDYPTIQAAINAAVNGDIVLVSPGTYYENLVISGKTITLGSLYHTTQDDQYIGSTVIDGQGGAAVISISSNVGPATTIEGFTIQNGFDGMKVTAKVNILNNRIVGNDDGIDYENGGGVFRGNVVENNTDDGVDLDLATEVLIENNIIRNNHEDGIEIRLEAYSGPFITIGIKNNLINGHGQDGIQLISFPGVQSNRIFYIERNVIKNSDRVGLGLMDDGRSGEDYRAASITDRIHLFNNTFNSNRYAVTGGDNLIAVNNVFLNSRLMGLKNVDGNSIASYNLFWGNATHYSGSNIDASTTIIADPLLDSNERPMPGSAVLDQGTALFVWNGETVLNYPPSSYLGAAPDIGKYESEYTADSPTFTPTPGSTLTFTPLADATILSTSPNSNFGSNIKLQVDNSPFEDFLIKFSVSGINGRTINSVVLRLYNVNSSYKGGDFYFVPDNSWQENTVTWNNAPTANPTILYSLGSVVPNNWYDVDLTSLITQEGVYSLRVKSTAGDGADYSSKEGANPPQLLIGVSGLPGPTSTPVPPTATITSTPTPSLTPAPPTATNTPLPTATFTPLPTSTHTPIPTATNTPLPTATNTPLPTPTNTPLPTPTNTPLPTATNTPLPTSTVTPLPTATNTPLPTATNTPLPTATNTPPPTATNTPLPTATNTPLPTATNTPLPTATNTPLPTATNTPLPTATNTPLPTATNTPLPTATNTPLPTATNTPLPTATNTPLPTATNTPLPTATNTPLPTATNTPLPTATNTPLPTATNTPLPTATNTPLPTATNTPLPTATNTPLPTATNTPLPTATNTPLPTATNTPLPTATNTPLPTATSTPIPPTPTPTSLPDLIFADGFESGNMSAWSFSATGGGDLSVTAGAALAGNFGLSALINDLDLLYVTDDRPAAEPAYRARFYLHTNGTRMPGNKGFVVFYGYSVTNTPILLIEIQSTKGGYLLRTGTRDTSNNWTYTAWVTVTDASHIVEISWWAASGITSGGMVFWVDGTPRANLTGINNNTHRIERVSLGAVDALHPAIGGTVFFDAFESRRQTYIGP